MVLKITYFFSGDFLQDLKPNNLNHPIVFQDNVSKNEATGSDSSKIISNHILYDIDQGHKSPSSLFSG